MKVSNRPGKYRKKTTFSRNMNKGFSFSEVIITIAVSSLLMTSMIASLFFLIAGLTRVEERSVKLAKISEFFDIICSDVLSPDIYPHRQLEDYTFEEDAITFYANGGEVEYSFLDGVFQISKKEFNDTYDIIKEFSISYFDKDEFEVTDEEEMPYYCELKFKTSDNKEVILKMRL